MSYFNRIHDKLKFFLQGVFCASLFLLSGCSTGITANAILDFLKAKKESCWPCIMYKVIWEKIGDLVEELYPSMCSNALVILGVALLFWICFTVGKLVGTLKEPNLKDFIGNMATVLFKAFVVAVILSVPAYTIEILGLIVSTTLNAFVDITINVMFSNETIAKTLATTSMMEGDHISASSGIFTSEIGNNIQDLIYRIYLGFYSGMGLGFRMMMSADITMIATGGFVTFIFFYLMLVFPLLFIESFALLSVIVVLFPFILVAYVFPSTKAYAQPAWKAVFVAMAQILITGIYMAIMVNVVHTYSENVLSPAKIISDPVLMLGLRNMQDRALAFFALVYVMFRMSSDIPNISSRILGDFNRSAMLGAITRTLRLGKNIGLAVGGAALTGTGVAGGIGISMMQSAGEGMKNIVRSPQEGERGGTSVQDQHAAQQKKG